MGRSAESDFAGTERFEIRRKLGAGGMGDVYQAFDRERGALIAIKTLPRASAANLYRFKREFRALADIEHPNLIGLGELIESEGQWFFTMDYVDGVDFLRYVRGEPSREDETSWDASVDGAAPTDPAIADSGRSVSGNLGGESTMPTAGSPPPATKTKYDERRLRSATSQLALAIDALHQAGKIHRDIKPSNILVTGEGKLVLLDFGLVADVSDEVHASSQGSAVGTAVYMAPEQAVSGAVGPAADWFSFGVVLYQALTGAVPYTGRTSIELLMKKQNYEPPPPRARNADVPRDLDGLCADLLVRDPAERPFAREVLDRLGIETTATALLITTQTSSQYTESSIFVGREAELETLHAAFRDTRQGSTEIVLIEGESGMGKSTLMARFLEHAAAEDAVVLAGRCYERESVPYKALDGVVDALSHYLRGLPKEEAAALLPLDTGLLSRAFPMLGRVEVVARAPRPIREVEDPPELRKRTFAAVRELFLKLAESRPVVVAIDDMQWADRDSLVLLDDLLRPPRVPPLLLLLTARLGAQTEDGGVAEDTEHMPYLEMLAAGRQRRVELRPLGAEVARDLATLLLARAEIADGVSPTAIATEAGGHPLYIHELVRHAVLSGHPERLRLDEVIAARVANLAAAARAILELICVAGGTLPQELVARAAELGGSVFRRQLSVLRLAHLVRTGGTRGSDAVEAYHDRVREAVLATIPEATRTQHHARLAVVLESAGAREDLLLRHLEAAGEVERAARFAEQAGDRAVQALAFDRAAQLYRGALDLGSWDEDERRALQLRLGGALINSGFGSEAAETYREAAKGADAVTRLHCERQAAEQLLISGHIDEGLAGLDALLREVGVSLPSSSRRALVSVLLRRARLRLRGLHWKERDPGDILARDLSRIDTFKAVSQGLGMVDPIRGADFHVRGLRLALKTGEPLRVGRLLAQEAIYVASEGLRSLGRARLLCGEASRIAEANDDPYLLAWTHAARGTIKYFAGEYTEAARLCREADRKFRDETIGTWWERSSIGLFRIYALTRTGDFVELMRTLDQYLRDAARRGDQYAETTAVRGGYMIWLVNDDPAAGRMALAQTSWTAESKAFHLQHWYELVTRGECSLYEQSTSEHFESLMASFRRFDRSLLRRIETVRIMALSLRGRLWSALAAGGDDDARSKTARIVRTLRRERLPLAWVQADLLEAAISSQRGKPERVIRLLKRAAELGDEHDLKLFAAASRRRLGELYGGTDGAQLIAEADAWMTSQDVVNPERMTEAVAPGFGRDS